MNNLSEERKFLVTASNAHRIMAGYEKELQPLEFEPFLQWQDVYEEVKKGVIDIRTLKKQFKTITAKQRDDILKLIEHKKPFQLTKGMESYAMEIAQAYFTKEGEDEENYQSDAMKNGVLTEYDAVNAAEKYLNVEFDLTLENQQFFKIENIGATPDGMLFDDLFLPSEGLEVKRPTRKVHFFNLNYIQTQDDLLKEYPNYYWQCMTGIAVTGAKKWHWFSHNDTLFDDYSLVHVEVNPVDIHIKLLKKRAALVIERANNIVNDLKNKIEIKKAA